MIRIYHAPLACIAVAILLCGFILASDLGEEARGRYARGLAGVQDLLQALLLEPLGVIGTLCVVMGTGLLAAALCWPRDW